PPTGRWLTQTKKWRANLLTGVLRTPMSRGRCRSQSLRDCSSKTRVGAGERVGDHALLLGGDRPARLHVGRELVDGIEVEEVLVGFHRRRGEHRYAGLAIVE